MAIPSESSFAATLDAGSKQTFIATAYYSPLPDQVKYYLGSYEADMRLNGGGTHGADGTPVYAGMISAPSSYSFGTKILLDGLGVVSVHDRGGAIVKAEDGSHAYDRIDIWMGYGDAARERTIAWGRREILGSVVDSSTSVSVNLDSIVDQAPKALDIALQKLAALGYTRDADETTARLIERFQLERGVIASSDDPGAGNYGPKTQAALASAYEAYSKNQTSLPQAVSLSQSDAADLVARHDAQGASMTDYTGAFPQSDAKSRALHMRTTSIGQQADSVKNLQNFLRAHGYYLGEEDGIMTRDVLGALRRSQSDHDLIMTGRVDIRTQLKIIDTLS